MYCPKCGQMIENDSVHCRFCGAAVSVNPYMNNTTTANTANYPPTGKSPLTVPMTLLIIGSAIAAVIFLISWSEYGKVYFFDGYAITSFGWIATALCYGVGLFTLVSKLPGVLQHLTNSQRTTMIVAVLIVPAILIASFAINANRKSTYTPSYDYGPDYYQNTYESCHTTAQHKQALYSYDLDNDGTISAYEMELFCNAHPKIYNDKQFMAWAESLVD